MTQTGVYLYIPNMVIDYQMFQQRLLSNQSLGKENQERTDPITPRKRPPRAGLGYFLGEVTEKPTLLAGSIIWRNDEPVWLDQHPVTKKKLQAAQRLVL